MGTPIITGFDMGAKLPIDPRFVKADIAARNAITQRYEGLAVYVVSEMKTYQLQGGIANTNWVATSVNGVDFLKFNIPGPITPIEEGELRWNATDDTLDLGMSGGDITLQIGQETFIKVRNQTGSTLLNGAPVYINGANALLGIPTVALASCRTEDISQSTIGILTKDIPDGENGYCTVRGLVRNINTSSLVAGDKLYVGTTPGTLVTSIPDEHSHGVLVGIVVKVGVTTGSILCRGVSIFQPLEVNAITGFHKVADSIISFTDMSRTFSITPINPIPGFSFYQGGVEYFKFSTETIIIDDIEGIHYIWYDNGILQKGNNLTKQQVLNAIESVPLICQLYWDATNKKAIIVGDERHGFDMAGETHSYLHMVNGPKWFNGMTITNLVATGLGTLATDAQFGVDSGILLDEDLDISTAEILSTVGLPILYKIGSSDYLRKSYQPGFPVLTDVTAGVGATGRLVYNKLLGGTWSLETVPDGKWVLSHVFATNDVNNSYIAFIGETYYNSLADAKAGALTEITPIAINTRKEEFLPIATVLFQTDSTYVNAVKSRIVEVAAGVPYYDWRISTSMVPVSGGGVPDHNSTTGKQGGAPNEMYHLTNASYLRANGLAAAGYVSPSFVRMTGTNTFALDTSTYQVTDAKLSSLIGLTYTTTAFVKMIGANSFQLDLNTYSLASHLHTGVYAPASTVSFPGFGTIAGTSCEGNDSRVVNGQTAFTWGNHVGLYTPLAHKTTEDAINGIVKVNGAGTYSAVLDNSGNWNTAFGWGNHAGLYATKIHNLIDTTNHPVLGLVAGQIIKATAGTTYAFGYNTQFNSNTTQLTGFATDTYISGSSITIPNASLKAKSKYKFRISITKTGAGTQTPIFAVRFGTNGTTADTALLTFTFTPNGTAHADTAIVDIDVVFRTVGVGSAAVVAGMLSCLKERSTDGQGFINIRAYAAQLVSAGFDSTVNNSVIGVSFNGGTAFSGTVEFVEATLENLI
jgi:hypothetical protein